MIGGFGGHRDSMNDYQPYIGRVVKELRLARSWSQEQLATNAGIDLRTLKKIERGDSVRAGYGEVSGVLGGFDNIRARVIQMREEQQRTPPQAPPQPIIIQRYQAAMALHLNQVDEEVRRRFGALSSPTRDAGSGRHDVFSSRKLIASLTTLGIPVEAGFRLLDDLPDMLSQLVAASDSLSTNHVRSAVARLIERLPADVIEQTGLYQLREELSQEDGRASTPSPEQLKADWASRYARRYGGGERAIQILQRDGNLTDLNFNFLKDELLPHVLKRLLGKSFSLENNRVISKETLKHMARETLDEFIRLGLYTIRYKTALRIAEDLAMHPPHPWLVIEGTRQATVDYDFAKARENIVRLKDPAEGDRASVAYRYMESLRHIASGILGIYSGFLGNHETSPLHLLYAALGLEKDNRVLWERCRLRLIDSDLQTLLVPKQELMAQLKRSEMSTRTDTPFELAERCHQFLRLAEQLREHRDRMDAVEAALNDGSIATHAELLALARETVISCLGGRRLKALEDRSLSVPIGLIGSVQTEDSVLRNRSASVIFLLCADPNDDALTANLMRQTKDQIAAHQASKTALLLCASEPGPALFDKMRTLQSDLARDELVGCISIEMLRRQRAQNLTIGDILDDIFT